MTEAEFLERFDVHLERIDEHIATSKEHAARGNQIMARSNEVMERSSQVIEEQRDFVREMTRRNEVVMRELVREISAGREVLLDVHREAYAQREAIWTLIDELRSKGLGGHG